MIVIKTRITMMNKLVDDEINNFYDYDYYNKYDNQDGGDYDSDCAAYGGNNGQ